MFYTNNRNQLRQFYYDTWQKHKTHQALNDLEKQILAIMLEHPEYQNTFENNATTSTQDFSETLGQANPFMHMGLHLAVRDQIALDQPPGIQQLFQQQLNKGQKPHDLEHQIMDILAEQLWQDTQAQKPLDMANYLENLKKTLI